MHLVDVTGVAGDLTQIFLGNIVEQTLTGKTVATIATINTQPPPAGALVIIWTSEQENDFYFVPACTTVAF